MSTGNYKFRGLDCTGLSWHVSGTMLDAEGRVEGGGVLEWCRSERDAQCIMQKMQECEPNRFLNLHVGRMPVTQPAAKPTPIVPKSEVVFMAIPFLASNIHMIRSDWLVEGTMSTDMPAEAMGEVMAAAYQKLRYHGEDVANWSFIVRTELLPAKTSEEEPKVLTADD